MLSRTRRNAWIATGLAILFWWAFEFAKHDQTLSKIIPFGDDPYDAVSSFAVIAAMILAVLSGLRSVIAGGAGHEYIYALRAQAAISFCVLVTVSSELVSMARYRSMWVGKVGAERLLALEVLLVVLATGMLLLTKNGQCGGVSLRAKAAAIWGSILAILNVYPERWIASLPGHLFTVVLGAVFLFAPVSALVVLWLPDLSTGVACRKWKPFRFAPLASSAVIGAVVGACAYLAEVWEGSMSQPLTRILFVGGVFVSLGTCGVAIGYAFLGRLLGLGLSEHSN